MNDTVKQMLDKYNCRNTDDYENALKEIIQEITLLGLWRAKFFNKAAFYGGSALRILYGLDRFSGDLDFSLLKSDKTFSLEPYCREIESELSSYGFNAEVESKQKPFDSNIESAFIKTGTLSNLLTIDTVSDSLSPVHPGKVMKIKFEVDIDPPHGFSTEAKNMFLPAFFSVNTYILPDLFAGKMHAVLCRGWGTRVKGRDWYDFLWYSARNVPLNSAHLKNRMIQSGHLKKDQDFNCDILKELFLKKIKDMDIKAAKSDVARFLADNTVLDVWSKDFFIDAFSRLRFI